MPRDLWRSYGGGCFLRARYPCSHHTLSAPPEVDGETGNERVDSLVPTSSTFGIALLFSGAHHMQTSLCRPSATISCQRHQKLTEKEGVSERT